MLDTNFTCKCGKEYSIILIDKQLMVIDRALITKVIDAIINVVKDDGQWGGTD